MPVQTDLIALGVVAVVLLVATVVTARRPSAAVPDLDGYLQRWRDLHGGYDPRSGSIWVRVWLVTVFRIARPLARWGVRPDVLTIWTMELAAAVVLAASAGGHWLLVAAWLVLFVGLFDSLDGGVALLSDRATRWGYVFDSLVDRVTDALFVVALVVAGAPAALGVGCVAVFFLLEYLRARGSNAGAGEIGTVTVGERPNRVAFTAATLHSAGLFLSASERIATGGLAVLTLLSVAGLIQLTIAVYRRLR